jgi:adenylate cyclase
VRASRSASASIDPIGDGVAIAARLEDIAAPDNVCRSGAAYRQRSGRLDMEATIPGDTRRKNAAMSIQVSSLQINVPAKAKPASPKKRPARAPLAVAIAALCMAAAAGVM